MVEEVVLVNEQDEAIGTMEKMQAHHEGVLHRAFSVFIFNDAGEMLLQRRAMQKYHSPGLWTNACCSHPRPGEETASAAHRRLQEELNFDVQLKPLEPMLYRAEVGDGLIEHEYDHLFSGRYSDTVTPAPQEVSETRYIALSALQDWMKARPQDFTAWFHLALPRVMDRSELTAELQSR